MLLEMRNIHVYYGVVPVLRGLSLCIEEGEIVTLIGANGAGKTTAIRAISGLIRCRVGDILFEGKKISNMKAEKISRMGVSHCMEGRRLFPLMTVFENIEMGAYARKDKEGIQEDIEYTFRLFPRLRERKEQTAYTLSGGEQQMLALGRALMARPKLILMDEPSLGLAPLIIDLIAESIREIAKKKVTILLVEQNAALALDLADRGYVLENGGIVAEGKTSDLIKGKIVQEAYIGKSDD